MSLEYTRQCDGCKKFVACEMTYFTECMWFCEGCMIRADHKERSVDSNVIVLYGEHRRDDIQKSLGKDTLINITASKEELIDISRAIGMALVVGDIDTETDNKKIIIKVKK